MLQNNTPIEYHSEVKLWVKREDLSCDGPRFSKTRGVLAHIAARPERMIGVLDTFHSQGGWAVARACAELGRECHLWYPVYKADDPQTVRPQQMEAMKLGAILYPLPAGRSAILYHTAKKQLLGAVEARQVEASVFGYMMPNALKLPESVSETAAELVRSHVEGPPDATSSSGGVNYHRMDNVLVSCSSGTIAAGVLKGLAEIGWSGNLILHMGYDRSEDALIDYLFDMSGVTPFGPGSSIVLQTVNERYSYKDEAPRGASAPFPCNSHYDLKAYDWWQRNHQFYAGETLLWNIG
ncbi:MAG: hypothetical protein JWN75_1238 [Candidatus Saccharibacteria bacterium]|nr:hypothetical protein [Candidatus Saccharibacteria bacterium]